MLRVCDLNQLIKHYAFQLQQRIEELDHGRSCAPTDQEEDEEDALLPILARYAGQASSDPADLRLAARLRDRVMQIYDFFKARSNNQNVLSAIQAAVDQQLASCIAADSVRLGDLLAHVHRVARRGAVIRPPAQRRPLPSRSTARPPKPERVPHYSLFNLQRRPSTSTRAVRTSGDRGELVQQLWGALEFDRSHLLRVREGNEELIAREMLRRNERARNSIRQSERRRPKMGQSQELRSSALAELKNNGPKPTFKTLWNAKKRVSALPTKQRSAKENLSLFV